jgi:dihydrofolate reductase
VARLIYSAITSLDGYIEDESGSFDWAAPDAEMLAFLNALERPIGTYLYGRRMYETMLFWETAELDALDPESRDFAGLWRQADKIVYSRTLQKPKSAQTQLVREFDPEAVRLLKESAARDITIGGPEIAGRAIGAGLVDEVQLYLNPVIVGGGKSALPSGVQVHLELLDEHRFQSGAVFLSYAVTDVVGSAAGHAGRNAAGHAAD